MSLSTELVSRDTVGRRPPRSPGFRVCLEPPWRRPRLELANCGRAHGDSSSQQSRATLGELKVFLTLAEELHFGRTAERPGLTSSRVSQIVRSLERKLGGQLVY